MTDFLLELLSEEIPARMQPKARTDLEKLFVDELAKAGLAAASIETPAAEGSTMVWSSAAVGRRHRPPSVRIDWQAVWPVIQVESWASACRRQSRRVRRSSTTFAPTT